MRFYEFEAKQLLAGQGIVTTLTPGPSPAGVQTGDMGYRCAGTWVTLST